MRHAPCAVSFTMDPYTFFDTIIQAVARDVELDAWAVSSFGQGVTVYADIDSDQDGDRGDMPYILFAMPGYSAHQDRAVVEWRIEAWMALNKDAFTVRTEDNVTEPGGGKLMLEFFQHVRNAIKADLPAHFSFGGSIDTDTVGQMPEVHGAALFEFTQRITIGTDPLG